MAIGSDPSHCHVYDVSFPTLNNKLNVKGLASDISKSRQIEKAKPDKSNLLLGSTGYDPDLTFVHVDVGKIDSKKWKICWCISKHWACFPVMHAAEVSRNIPNLLKGFCGEDMATYRKCVCLLYTRCNIAISFSFPTFLKVLVFPVKKNHILEWHK